VIKALSAYMLEVPHVSNKSIILHHRTWHQANNYATL